MIWWPFTPLVHVAVHPFSLSGRSLEMGCSAGLAVYSVRSRTFRIKGGPEEIVGSEIQGFGTLIWAGNPLLSHV